MDEYTEERYPGVTEAELRRERAGRGPGPFELAAGKALRRHVFHPSGQFSYGRRICTCGSLEKTAIHRVPERSDEEREHEQRRTGERA